MSADEPVQDLRVHRIADRQTTDPAALRTLLDEALVAHVALVRDGLPVVLPVGCARDGETLLLHGSTGGGLFRDAAAGAPIAVGVTLLDGLVFARSMFDSSMNYRSAMIVGRAERVPAEDLPAALRALSEHLMPGRWDEVRDTRRREEAATMVLRLPLERASVKIRAAHASAAEDDGEDRGVWAGVLPIALAAGAPAANDDVPDAVPVPASVAAARARFRPPRRAFPGQAPTSASAR